MADWSLIGRDWPPNQFEPYQHPYPACEPYYQEKTVQEDAPSQPVPAQPYPTAPSPMLSVLLSSPQREMSSPKMQFSHPTVPRGDNPREIRNKAEKQRRDKLNQSIAELAAMVPPVVAAKRKIDKTGVLRLTAHYLRAHQYVFGDSLEQTSDDFRSTSVLQLLGLLNGFLLTTTYRGLVVVVSQNVHEYLGYTELDLLGHNILNMIHEDDRHIVREQLMPKRDMLGPNGELLFPDGPDGQEKVAEALARQKRRFIVRFKKLSQRSEPCQYVTCHVEGNFRKSDGACRGHNKCCQMVRRVRARSDNPCSSGNDVVFIGMVRPNLETFINESSLESFKMEYRTRHSIDGEIIQCEQRIALVTGYMTNEVAGVNALNFMHRDDVRWVAIALREMYDQHRVFGESCYRLMTKNGQFVYMRTRGRLDVDHNSRAVTSFVCTNTVVGEEEGKELIKLMKKKFTLMVNNNDSMVQREDTEEDNNSTLPVENPRKLEKVILHLVTNLPSPEPDDNSAKASPDPQSPAVRLAIIPPRKEKIVSAIEKIYTVIKTIPKDPEQKDENVEAGNSPSSYIDITQNTISPKPLEGNKWDEYTSLANDYGHGNETVLKESQNLPVRMKDKYDQHKLDDYENNPSFIGSDLDLSQPSKSGIEVFAQGNALQKLPKLSSITYRDAPVKPVTNIIQVATGQHFLVMSGLKPDEFSIAKNANQCTIRQPAMDLLKGGMKRAIDVMEINVTTKKKISDLKQNSRQEGMHGSTSSDSTPLENFFDEAILNTQIESAINSLEQTIDPSFPDLLISKEVQDILNEIEDVPDGE